MTTTLGTAAALVAILLACTAADARPRHAPMTGGLVCDDGGKCRSGAEPNRKAAGALNRTARVGGAFTSRDCLHHSARGLLAGLEARFGKVALVKTCVPGARMPSGHVSWHARNQAFDFIVPGGVDKRDVMVWLTRNSPGVTISYSGKLAGIIHTDTGTFHKVIYNAANHEAGHRAVAVWQAREVLASHGNPVGTAAGDTKPRRQPPPAPPVVASWGAVEPTVEEYAMPTPEPVTWGSDPRNIFRRYFDSRDVVVGAHTTLNCVDGRLVRLVKDAATHFGKTAYINSGYRTPERNRRVGGARNSQHMKCRAVDFRLAGIGISDLRRYVVANIARWGVTGLGTYGSHLHTDVGARKTTKLVAWFGRHKKHVRYAKHRKPHRVASAG